MNSSNTANKCVAAYAADWTQSSTKRTIKLGKHKPIFIFALSNEKNVTLKFHSIVWVFARDATNRNRSEWRSERAENEHERTKKKKNRVFIRRHWSWRASREWNLFYIRLNLNHLRALSVYGNISNEQCRCGCAAPTQALADDADRACHFAVLVAQVYSYYVVAFACSRSGIACLDVWHIRQIAHRPISYRFWQLK